MYNETASSGQKIGCFGTACRRFLGENLSIRRKVGAVRSSGPERRIVFYGPLS